MPLTYQQSKNFGPSGLAEVRVLKTLVKVIFEDGDMYELQPSGWPEGRPAGHYIVSLNKDRDKAYVKPPAGMYLGRFAGMPRPQGGTNPEPYIERGGPRKSKDGGTWYAPDEMRFKVSVEVIDESKAYDGLTVTSNLPYIFEQAPGLPTCIVIGKKTQIARLDEGLRTLGYDATKDDDIPYSPNVLPWLERWLLDHRKVFQMTLNEKGWIASMTQVKENLLPAWVTKHK